MLRGLLDRLVLLAAVACAACVPSFIVQYRQRLGGRLDQLLADLAPFQLIANQRFGGSLSRLVHYHLDSRDATFHQEGMALQRMIDAAAQLRAAVQALGGDLLHQCLYLAGQPDVGMLRATWASYQPGFTLTLQGALFSVALGGLIWLLFLGSWHGVAALLRSPRSTPRARASIN